MTKVYFNPGCALTLYKPHMEDKILRFLNENCGETRMHKICCRHDPRLEAGSVIINVCPGCDRRFRSLYKGITTVSLWEVLDGMGTFPYPDYKGISMSILDACPVREKPQVHKAVRSLLKKMNIDIIEPEFSGTRSVCCGDGLYPDVPIAKVRRHMKKRADSMPCNEVCVYCVSCIKSMYIGGKSPKYLVDLLMGEDTEPQVYDTVQWHKQLDDYIEKH